MTEPIFGSESAPVASNAAAWPPAEPDETQAAVPEPDSSPEVQQPEPETPEVPEPDWLVEIRNNAPAYIVAALEDIYRRIRHLEK